MQNEELDVRAKREQLEADKMTRRAALKKMGLTTGFALFGMFAVDDLARMTMTRLQQMHLHNEVVSTVAKEFKNVGVAFANPPKHSSPCYGCGYHCTEDPDWICESCGFLKCGTRKKRVPRPCTRNSGCAGCGSGTDTGKCCGGGAVNNQVCTQCCQNVFSGPLDGLALRDCVTQCPPEPES